MTTPLRFFPAPTLHPANDAPRSRPLSPSLIKVGDVTWHEVRIADGSFGWSGRCPLLFTRRDVVVRCEGRLHSGCVRVKSFALRCSKCGTWHRLP
jgi:hypothetical protein